MNKIDFQKLISTLPNTLKVLYYDGSFDPFHFGHLSALQGCSKIYQPDVIFVIAHNKNKFKPNLIDFDHRTQIILLSIGKLPYHIRRIVYVLNIPGENHWIKNELSLRFSNLALLMGTDSLKFFNFDRNPKISKFFISVRKDESIDYLVAHRVTPFSPEITDCSSTKIRRLLKEFYLNKSKSQDLISLIPIDVIGYIQNHRLYYPEFKQFIDDLISTLELDFQTKEIQPLFEKRTPSENYCFKVENKNFVKCYAKKNHMNECNFERKGMKLLQKLGIIFKPSSAKPKYRHLFHFSYLCTPFVETQDVAKDLQNCKNDLQFESLCKKFAIIGKSLAELHLSQPIQSIDEVVLEAHLERMRAKLRSKRPLEKLDDPQWKQYFLLEQEYIGNPGVHTLTHGDPNLGNFIVEENKVTLLDLDRFYHCFQLGNHGFPVDDFYRLIASVHWERMGNAKNAGNNFIKDNHSQQLIQTFSQSYHQTIGTKLNFTQESIQFYSFYWNLRNNQ